jgi:hypothetical protein
LHVVSIFQITNANSSCKSVSNKQISGDPIPVDECNKEELCNEIISSNEISDEADIANDNDIE